MPDKALWLQSLLGVGICEGAVQLRVDVRIAAKVVNEAITIAAECMYQVSNTLRSTLNA